MKMHQFALALAAANLVILVVALGKVIPSTAHAVAANAGAERPAAADDMVPFLRGRALALGYLHHAFSRPKWRLVKARPDPVFR